MDLDSFLISIIFDNATAKDSAKKIEDTVNNLKNTIISAFTSILSIDFLKNAVDSSIKLATQLDNLSYATNISKENLNAWGEAAKRSGGTVEGFYGSISSLSEKIRDMQTNFGSAGQLVFARLGISIKDSTGHIKNAVEILGEVGDKFKSLPKVWQQDLGKQLGLDQGTIRLISDGNEEALKLVANMAKLGQINELNSEKNIKFRNSLYDISLVFESIKIKIANALIPVLERLSELLLKSMRFLQEHSTLLKVILTGLSVFLTGTLLSAIATTTSAIIKLGVALALNPASLLIAGLIILGLVLEDLKVYLDGGSSALERFYDWVSESKLGKSVKHLIDLMDQLTKKFRDFFGITQHEDPLLKDIENYRKELEKVDDIKDKNNVTKNIGKVSLELGVDPDVAASIANIESGLNPNAKSGSSTASGLFQLTDATAFSNGISDLSKKNDVNENIRAGITNLRKITDGLTTFLGRKPTGGEVYLGEHFGLSGSKNLLSANQDTMISSIFNDGVLNANPQYKGMTAGQLINNLNKTYESKSITVGEIKINAPGADASKISQNIYTEFQKQFSNFATNIDNGIRN